MTKPLFANLIVGDQPTTCPTDGARTHLLGGGIDGSRIDFMIERCPACGAIYHCYDEDEDEDIHEFE